MKVTWEILTHPNTELRTVALPMDLSEIKTPEYQAFANAFAAFMLKSDGIGLAATQIGLHKRVIAILEKDRVGVFANPEILKASKTLQENEEGCLSVPRVYGMVERSKRIRIRAIDRHGKKVEFNVAGFPAAVFQHEIDHLNGILFIDKTKKITQGKPTVQS